MLKNSMFVQRAVAMELDLCLAVNRRCQRSEIKRFFTVVSELGDGVFWYGLILVLPIAYGMEAVKVSVHMLACGGISLVVYKLLKSSTSRKRPCDLEHGITAATPPLDLYSFPSGHTLHAVSFSVVAIHYYPELGLLLLPMTGLIAVSRVILGLHFPTDVVAGALLGNLIAVTFLGFVG